MLTPAILEAELAKPLPKYEDDYGDNVFDPWALFPAIYGSYSSDFADAAILVLENICAGRFDGETLPHEILREMLCVSGVCTYGTSPRVCFPENATFKRILNRWLPMMKAEYEMRFNHADT